MFQLAEIRHMVRIPPWLFGQTLNDAVIEELNRKLANKVATQVSAVVCMSMVHIISPTKPRESYEPFFEHQRMDFMVSRAASHKVVLHVGLCIALFDITSLGDSYIFPGDGASHTRVTFRYVVFRPFLEEILEGVIKSADADGMQVSLGFYDDIYIRKDSMMANSHFDETDQTWVWDYQTEDDTHHLFMDVGGKIRFKVVAEQFIDTTPAGPNLAAGDSAVADRKEGKVPYIVYGAINDQGLGLVSWWTSSEEGQEEDEEEEEGDDAL